MLVTSNIKENSFFPGWIGEYAQALEPTRFPLSFQLFMGASVLTSVVGQKCRLRGVGYTLYPPLWVFLVGNSGVGKSQSMEWAAHILEIVEAKLSETGPFIFWNTDQFTVAGFMERSIRVQQAAGASFIEGQIQADEFAAVVKSRTGTENASQLLCKLGDFKTGQSTTVTSGTRTLTNSRLGYVAASSMEMLRPNVNYDEFVGGLIFRFIPVVEMEQFNGDRSDADEGALQDLAERALRIRQEAPEEIELAPGARALLNRLRQRRVDNPGRNVTLIGYWNRIDSVILKLAIARALSEFRFRILEEDIEIGNSLIDKHLYPPLDEMLWELQQGRTKAALLHLVDSLYFCDAGGMSLQKFIRRLPGTTTRAVNDSIKWLEMQQLVYLGKKHGEPWLWRKAEWAMRGSDHQILEDDEG